LATLGGLAVLAAFVLWERRLAASGRMPLVDLGLFRSRRFTSGLVCTAFGVFALFGVLFALPQYFQAVMGVDPQGSGVRLLPAVVGLIVGAVPADRLAARIGARLTVGLGFLVVALGSLAGATMAPSTSDGFIAAWTFVVGAGAGLGFATAASTALVELPADRSGVGSALLQAMVKLGPAFGATILGSVLNSTYQARVPVAALPPAAADAVRGSVFGGIAVAAQAGSSALLDGVRSAFVAGMDDALRVAAIASIIAGLVALAAVPDRARERGRASEGRAEWAHERGG
ncbi:MAG TPA: MFS transporter, partial [Candidatus Dormibacteraeota bacterium]|nr:MFS transporter [Candidatus Dormibacteraeota bacterium]